MRSVCSFTISFHKMHTSLKMDSKIRGYEINYFKAINVGAPLTRRVLLQMTVDVEFFIYLLFFKLIF